MKWCRFFIGLLYEAQAVDASWLATLDKFGIQSGSWRARQESNLRPIDIVEELRAELEGCLEPE